MKFLSSLATSAIILGAGHFVILANPSPAVAVPDTKPVKPTPPSKIPPTEVMDKFFKYLNDNYTLWLGDSRGACSYHVDPAGIRGDGDDRFFLAKISRGQSGTACRGVLAFRIMQADCKANKLYEFVREQKEDMRVAGWERYEATLRDPASSREDKAEPLSQKVLSSICRQ
jgi:hypothetical protein